MVRVRPAAVADLERMRAIAQHSATAAHWSSDQYESLFTPDSVQRRCALVVEEDAQVAGFIVARTIADAWEIENIAVSPDARRRGLGSRLLSEFLRRADRESGISVFLEVRESNLAARKLYEKWGFTQAGRRKKYYQGPPEDALILRLSFPDKFPNLG